MSVTFSIEANTTGAFTVTGGCAWDLSSEPDASVDGVTYPSIDDAHEALTAHKAACETCALYGVYAVSVMDAPTEFGLNVSNMNARTLLGHLGLGDSEYLEGCIDGADFLARVMLAIGADPDDSGTPDQRFGATMVFCGLPAGYLTDRLGALYTLAQEATRLGRSVQWY